MTQAWRAADTTDLLDLPGGRHPPGTLQEYVSTAINEAILAGRLRPGQRISTDALARQLHVSQIPVREALAQLEGQGQVVRRSYRGFYVPDQSIDDFRDAHRWREVLESRAYELAMERIGTAELAGLRALHKEMESAERRGDSVHFARANRRFHMLPVRLVGSERLERFLNHLWSVCDLYYATLVRAGVELPKLQRQHREMIVAFEARDAAAVNALMSRHRQSTYELVEKGLAARLH